MTTDDLRRYRAIERKPTRNGYRGLDIWGMGPPSSGGSTVGEALNILEGYRGLAADRVRALHLMLESSRFTFADRNAYLADPDFFDVPLAGLLSDSFAAERRALIDEKHGGHEPGGARRPVRQPEGQGQARAAAAPRSATRASRPPTSSSRTRKGNVVSYTFTIESTGGNAIVVPGYGFLLNNELTDFNFDSLTHPNRADGDKRPRSSMSPTIVTRGGRPFMAVGSPGGSTIPGTVLQVLLERLDLGSTLPEAIAAPARRPAERRDHAPPSRPSSTRPRARPCSRAGTPTRSMAEIGAVTGIEFLGGGRDARRGRAHAPRRRQRGGRAAVSCLSANAANLGNGL